MVTTLYFRDDDCYELDSHFQEIFELFQTLELPINYAVIPHKITLQFKEYLNKHQNSPFNVSQHGFTHKNYGKDKKYEFGPSRSLSEQYKDIAQGKKIMHQTFQSLFNNIFVPPYHGFDNNTLACLIKLKYKGISVNHAQLKTTDRVSVFPIHLSLETYSLNKPPIEKTLKKLLAEYTHYSRHLKTIGIYFHHSMLSENGIKNLELFLRYIKKEKDRNKVGPVLLGKPSHPKNHHSEYPPNHFYTPNTIQLSH